MADEAAVQADLQAQIAALAGKINKHKQKQQGLAQQPYYSSNNARWSPYAPYGCGGGRGGRGEYSQPFVRIE
jgi:hypothetical protein